MERTVTLFTVCAFAIAAVHIDAPMSKNSEPMMLQNEAMRKVALALMIPLRICCQILHSPTHVMAAYLIRANAAKIVAMNKNQKAGLVKPPR